MKKETHHLEKEVATTPNPTNEYVAERRLTAILGHFGLRSATIKRDQPRKTLPAPKRKICWK